MPNCAYYFRTLTKNRPKAVIERVSIEVDEIIWQIQDDFDNSFHAFFLAFSALRLALQDKSAVQEKIRSKIIQSKIAQIINALHTNLPTIAIHILR